MIALELLIHFFHGFTFLQTDLVEYGHWIWINPWIKESSTVFSEHVQNSEDLDVLIIRESADYSTFAVTNPGMYLAVNRVDLLLILKHYYLQHWWRHEPFKENSCRMRVRGVLFESLQCFLNCTFDVKSREYAHWHHFDWSAINIILKNWLGHKPV